MSNQTGDILQLSAVRLAHAIRAGVVSAREVVDRHISHIETVNPAINAVVANRFDAARAEADDADARIAAGESPPPLLGVPFTSKEMLWVEGMPSTIGAVARRDRKAPCDATVIARLRAAGAIPLGVTNEPEWGMWVETYNDVYGRTCNPYDSSRIPGGSSGGEGAIVGAGGVPFGIGSDIGGSVRMPAAMCGVFGHKPTHGMLPLTGHYPVFAVGPDADLHKPQPILSLGTISRHADDIAPLLRIMAGADGVDPNTEAVAIGDPAQIEWDGRQVFVMSSPDIALASDTTSEMRGAVTRAAHVLANRGATVSDAPPAMFKRAVQLWLASLEAGDSTFRETIADGRSVNVPAELLKYPFGHSRFTLPVLMFAAADSFVALTSARQLEKLRSAAAALDRAFTDLVGDGIILMPPHPRVAPKHNAPLRSPLDFAYTAILNVLRVPATVVPMGIGSEGLPLSVQIAARRGNDHVTIAAALALEEQCGGWIPPAHVATPTGLAS